MFRGDDESIGGCDDVEELESANDTDGDSTSEDSTIEDIAKASEWMSPALKGDYEEEPMEVLPVPECARCGSTTNISVRFIGTGKSAQFCLRCSDLFDEAREHHAIKFLGNLTAQIGAGSLLDGIKDMYPKFDRDNPDLKDTPRRVARMYAELCSGYAIDPDQLLAIRFDVNGSQAGLITIGPIDFVSTCMHHLASISGRVYVGYVPNQKVEETTNADGAFETHVVDDTYQVIGLSKIPRVVYAYSRRLILQEDMTRNIIECLERNLGPLGSAVFVKAKHDCMCKRGTASANAWTVTTEVRGVLYENQRGTKDEFMFIVEQSEMSR